MVLLLEPPAQYAHPYHGQVIEHRVSQAELIQLCRGPATGCSWVNAGACHLALPNYEKDRPLLALMRRHELGHCNGWPSYHPGGHWVQFGKDNGLTLYKSGHSSVTLF
jgi:hypothetical protein